MYIKLKLFQKVQILCVLLLLASGGLYAQQLKLHFKDVPLTTILEEITNQTGYRFVYSDALKEIHEKKTFSLDAANQPLKEVLKKLFTGKGIAYTIEGKQIVLAPDSIVVKEAGKQQGHKISGKVQDETGEVLPGITIQNKTTGKLTASEVDGSYSMEAKEGDILSFASIGMVSFDATVGKGSVLNVTMKPDVIALTDVVITGYQTLSKERSAGSFSVIKGDNIKDKSKLSGSIINGLEGLSTGLSVGNNSSSNLLVRGMTSINSKMTPLFVVDGIPLDESLVENMINSNDIASVTVLKDATAASIWGSQAANGVVVITTEKGKNNSRMKISYDGSFTYVGKPDYEYKNKMDGALFMKNAIEMFDQYSQVYDYNSVKKTAAGLSSGLIPSDSPIVFPHEDILYKHKNGEISLSQRDQMLAKLIGQDGRKSYEDNFMSNKFMTQHFISLNGGGEKYSYYVSLGYYGNKGIYKDWKNRFAINARQDLQITKWLHWDFTINTAFENAAEHVQPWKAESNSTYYYASKTGYRDFPYSVFEDESGMIDHSIYNVYADEKNRIEKLTKSDMGFYPVDDFNRSSLKNASTNVRINTGLSIQLMDGLKYEGRFQYSRGNRKTEQYLPSENWLVREERLNSTPASTLTPVVPISGGHFSLNNGVMFDWTVRNQLSYDKNINDGQHQITILAGTEIREYLNTNYSSFIRGYDMQTMQGSPYDIYGLSQGVYGAVFGSNYNAFYDRINSQTESAKRYFSLFANGAYTYNHKYSINASLRMDQSNLFGSDPSTQYKPIWSVGLAWKLSKEGFMKDVESINDLTLRASYGFAGNSPEPGMGGKYDFLSSVNSSRFETPGYTISSPANDKITWEKTRILNIGFDLRVFKNCLDISFDYYDKYTKDLLGVMNLNPTTGWVSTFGNLGELKNNGVEISVNSRNINHKSFSWSTNFTFSYNKNKVVKLNVATPYTAYTLMGATHLEGYPAMSLFAYKYAGLSKEGKPQAYDKDGNIVEGMDSYYLEVDDVEYMGTIVPKFYGGLTNRFTLKNWELSFMFVYNLGHKMRKSVNTTWDGRLGANLYNDFDKRWRKPGDEAITDIPAYSVMQDWTANNSLYYLSDRNILDASYIKLRDLSIAWNAPETFCKRLSLSGLRITAQAGNLFYIAANNEGIDPEAKALGSFMHYNDPDKFGASYSLGLTINF